jgi:hypothetical protein
MTALPLSLLLVAASTAAPPAPAEPASPASPATPHAWLSVAVGTGTGGWVYGGSGSSFTEALARDPLRLSAALEASAPLAERWLAGLRLSSLHLAAGTHGTETLLAVARLEAVATWRPVRAGPYVRLGLGPSGLWYDVRVPGLASGRTTAGGGGGSLAAGAYWPLGDRLELRVEAEASGQAWLPSHRGPDLSWTLGGSAGLAWR